MIAGASAIPSAKLPMERNQLKTREVPTSFPPSLPGKSHSVPVNLARPLPLRQHFSLAVEGTACRPVRQGILSYLAMIERLCGQC